jgi:hypothetical protein
MSESGDSPANDEEDVWPVEPSPTAAEILADPALTAEQFSKIVALTVAIAENPWLQAAARRNPYRRGGRFRSRTVASSSST